MSQIIVPLPYLLQFPRFYNGEITARRDDASPRRRSAASRTGCRSSATPTTSSPATGPRSSASTAWSSPTKKAGRCRSDDRRRVSTARFELDDVEVRTPDGKQLINPLDLRLEVGDTLVITGASGSGKTTLLRSLAELWPFTSGTLTRPCGPNETMFLSQLPYVPLGDLRAVVSYPNEAGTIDDDDAAAHAGEGRAAAPGRPPRRGAGLGQGALPRRAAADRVRPHPADQAEGGVPRRGDLGAGRRPGVHALQPGAHASCRTPSWSASATAAPSSSITRTNSSCSATASGGSAGWRAPSPSPV